MGERRLSKWTVAEKECAVGGTDVDGEGWPLEGRGVDRRGECWWMAGRRPWRWRWRIVRVSW